MAMPTSNNNVTVRKLVSVISSLWDKVKNVFQTKLPTTGTPSSTYSIGITGNSSTSDYPSGFNNRGTTTSWGTVNESNGYTTVTRWATQDGSEIAMGKKSGALSVQIDGMYYQNEGQYQVLDTSSRGVANGVASLDANGKVPSSQLPDTALKPISIYDGYKELDFSSVTFETFCGSATVENSFCNKLFGGSLDSTNKCIRCLVRLHLSFNIMNNLGVGEFPIAVVYITRQVGTLMIFSNDSYTYCVRMQIYAAGGLGSVHRFSPPSAVGSSSQPVFVNSDGSFSPCTNIPVIEHVTAIPSNPTVGTIYAL